MQVPQRISKTEYYLTYLQGGLYSKARDRESVGDDKTKMTGVKLAHVDGTLTLGRTEPCAIWSTLICSPWPTKLKRRKKQNLLDINAAIQTGDNELDNNMRTKQARSLNQTYANVSSFAGLHSSLRLYRSIIC